jgi:hypothetical protein
MVFGKNAFCSHAFARTLRWQNGNLFRVSATGGCSYFTGGSEIYFVGWTTNTG